MNITLHMYISLRDYSWYHMHILLVSYTLLVSPKWTTVLSKLMPVASKQTKTLIPVVQVQYSIPVVQVQYSIPVVHSTVCTHPYITSFNHLPKHKILRTYLTSSHVNNILLLWRIAH